MTVTDDNDWLNRQPPPVESAACFFGDCTHCPDPASCSHECHREMKRRLLEAMDRDGWFASLTTIRFAIADVVDAGDVALPRVGNHPHPWIFGADEREEQTECRERFMDAVYQRVKELQAPPHNMDTELQTELAKARKVLRRGRRR